MTTVRLTASRFCSLRAKDDYLQGKQPRFGRRNPDIMDIPFWRDMIDSGLSAYRARSQFDDTDSLFKDGNLVINPAWTFDRYGQSLTLLPDGRVITIGGEHEDSYDADFCIYNDVTVFDGKGGFTIYGYPADVFPPTDFHSATLVGSDIYIIGSLGYINARDFGNMPVYRLNCDSFNIEKISTSGDKPEWVFSHRARLLNNSIEISGGEIIRENQTENIQNELTYSLDLDSMCWRQSD